MTDAVFQSACMITEDKYLWIKPFLKDGRLRGYVLMNYKEAEQELMKELDKKYTKRKRGRPRKYS